MTNLLNTANPLFDVAFTRFIAALQVLISRHYAKSFPNLIPETLGFDVGKRYVRVFREGPSNRSAHCFVDLTNGDVLKCGGWKAPAPRGKRGSIYDDGPIERFMNSSGCNYLR